MQSGQQLSLEQSSGVVIADVKDDKGDGFIGDIDVPLSGDGARSQSPSLSSKPKFRWVPQGARQPILKQEEAIQAATCPASWQLATMLSSVALNCFLLLREGSEPIPQMLSWYYFFSSFPKNIKFEQKSVKIGLYVNEYPRAKIFSAIRQINGVMQPEYWPDAKGYPLPDGYGERQKDVAVDEFFWLVERKKLTITRVEGNKVFYVDAEWNQQLADCAEAMGGRYQVEFCVDFSAPLANPLRELVHEHFGQDEKLNAPTPDDANFSAQLNAIRAQVHANGHAAKGFPVSFQQQKDDDLTAPFEPDMLACDTETELTTRSDIDASALSINSEWPGANETVSLLEKHTTDENLAEEQKAIAIIRQLLHATVTKDLPGEHPNVRDFRRSIIQDFRQFLWNELHSDAKDVDAGPIDEELLAGHLYDRFARGTLIGDGSPFLIFYAELTSFIFRHLIASRLPVAFVEALNELNPHILPTVQQLYCHQADANYNTMNRKVGGKPDNVTAYLPKYDAGDHLAPNGQLLTLAALAQLDTAGQIALIAKLGHVFRLWDQNDVAAFALWARLPGQATADQRMPVSNRYASEANPDPKARRKWARRRRTVHSPKSTCSLSPSPGADLSPSSPSSATLNKVPRFFPAPPPSPRSPSVHGHLAVLEAKGSDYDLLADQVTVAEALELFGPVRPSADAKSHASNVQLLVDKGKRKSKLADHHRPQGISTGAFLRGRRRQFFSSDRSAPLVEDAKHGSLPGTPLPSEEAPIIIVGPRPQVVPLFGNRAVPSAPPALPPPPPPGELDLQDDLLAEPEHSPPAAPNCWGLCPWRRKK